METVRRGSRSSSPRGTGAARCGHREVGLGDLGSFWGAPGLLALCRWQFGPMVAITLLDWRRARWRLATVALGYLLMVAPSCGSTMSCSGPGCRSARRARLYPWPGHYLDILVTTPAWRQPSRWGVDPAPAH